jgi:hypothetical protein
VFSTLGAYLKVTDLLSCKVEWPSGYIVYENRKYWIFGSNPVSAIILPSSAVLYSPPQVLRDSSGTPQTPQRILRDSSGTPQNPCTFLKKSSESPQRVLRKSLESARTP